MIEEPEQLIEGRFDLDSGYYSLALIMFRSLKAAEPHIEPGRRLPYLETKERFFGKLIEKGIESFAESDPSIIPILNDILDYEERRVQAQGNE